MSLVNVGLTCVGLLSRGLSIMAGSVTVGDLEMVGTSERDMSTARGGRLGMCVDKVGLADVSLTLP